MDQGLVCQISTIMANHYVWSLIHFIFHWMDNCRSMWPLITIPGSLYIYSLKTDGYWLQLSKVIIRLICKYHKVMDSLQDTFVSFS